MSEPEVLDATAVEEPITPVQHESSPGLSGPSTELAVLGGSAGAIIRAEEPEEILAKATTIANALKRLIDGQGLAASMGGNRKHVEVGAWQACGTLLGALGGQPLHAETVWTRKVTGDDGLPIRTKYTATVKRYFKREQGGGVREETTYDVDGYDWEACVEVRTPSGVCVGRAEAMCSRDEETWSQRADYAVRSMAETRAESRAYRRAIGWIVHLAGYSPTPAEEMGHTPGAEAPAEIAEASAELKGTVRNVLGYLLEGNEPAVGAAMDALSKQFEARLPAVAGQALVIAGSHVKRFREQGPVARESDVPGVKPSDADLRAIWPRVARAKCSGCSGWGEATWQPSGLLLCDLCLPPKDGGT